LQAAAAAVPLPCPGAPLAGAAQPMRAVERLRRTGAA